MIGVRIELREVASFAGYQREVVGLFGARVRPEEVVCVVRSLDSVFSEAQSYLTVACRRND